MRLSLITIGFFLIVLSSAKLLAQSNQDALSNDTILLVDGSYIYTHLVDTTEGLIRYTSPKKSSRTLVLGAKEIFSIKTKGEETIYYSPDLEDSVSANNYSVEEMRYFLWGVQDGKKTKFSTFPFVSNILIGAGAGVTGHFLSPLIPFLSTALFNIPKQRVNQNNVSNMEYLNYAPYERGYKQEASRKRRIQTLLGGGIGFLAGITTSFILTANGIDLIK